ncbi:Uncharacterised protein [Vibrio cholerae]|uniref:Uncharacterized protein n=1 Tax=Vibrio cholerae TaxID=666 RepID=A0A655XRK1_VIBCL|nr:Uncharacterised protein [Vibrio cholerae]
MSKLVKHLLGAIEHNQMSHRQEHHRHRRTSQHHSNGIGGLIDTCQQINAHTGCCRAK